MVRSFLALLGSHPEEDKRVLLLLGKGFFMGVFLAAYEVAVEVIFLKTPGLGEEHLDKAIFAAGIFGLAATFHFVYLQKRMRFDRLAVTNLALFSSFLMAISFLYYFYDIKAGQEDTPFFYKATVFVSFMMLGPAFALILLGFWGTFNRLFDLRASKRIIGGIDTGQLTATIIAFFAIGLIPKQYYSSADMILVSAICITSALFFLIWIVKDYDLEKFTEGRLQEMGDTSYKQLSKNKYLRYLSLFLILSTAATVFMDFTFLTTVDTFYPEEGEMKTYLAFFKGVVMITSFIIQTFINDIIIGKYGLKVSLLVMPAILGLFVIGAIVGGFIYGYQVKNDELIYFFMFISMGRLFSAAFKDALESPAFKLFFLPLPINIRLDIQGKIEGVVNELASLFAGTLLVLLGLDFLGIELIHYCFFILAAIIGMYYITEKLYSEYRDTLRETLTRHKKKFKKEDQREEKDVISLLNNELESGDPDKVIYSLKLMEKVDPVILESFLLKCLREENLEIREYAYQKLNELKSLSTMDTMRDFAKKENTPEVKQLALKAVENISEVSGIKLSKSMLKDLVRSTDAEDRVYGAKLLANIDEDDFVPYLSELLRDINPKVRRAAIISAGKTGRPEFWTALVDNLASPSYSNTAAAALVNIGTPILPFLETAFNRTGQRPEVRVRIVQIYGRIGGNDAAELLWKKIDTSDKNIFTQVLESLSEMGYRAHEFQAARIKITIESDIEDIAWNLSALNAIPDEEEFGLLREALTEENKHNYEDIYMLLAMNYDAESIQLVKENVESGLSDNITYAIELLDVFITEDLKPKLFPILDDITHEERIKRLEEYYPPENFESIEEVFRKIINRDYNRINRWTKAVAIFYLGNTGEVNIIDDLVANLFNPDPLIRQTAAWALYKADKNEYMVNSRRIPKGYKKELDRLLLPQTYFQENDEKDMLRVERIIFLLDIDLFSKIPRLILAELGDYLKEVHLQPGKKLVSEGESGGAPMYVIVKGKVDVHSNGNKVAELGEKELIGETHVLDTDINTATFTASEKTTVFEIDKDKFYELIAKNNRMISGLISIMNKKIDEKEVLQPG